MSNKKASQLELLHWVKPCTTTPRPQTQVNRASRIQEVNGPVNMFWGIPWNSATPRYQTTTSQNLPTTPQGGEETQTRERLMVSLPLGGGKLRCRDVLGLGPGTGSCLNPEVWGTSSNGEKMKPRKIVGQAFQQGLQSVTSYSAGLWCWFYECVISWTALSVSWL